MKELSFQKVNELPENAYQKSAKIFYVKHYDNSYARKEVFIKVKNDVYKLNYTEQGSFDIKIIFPCSMSEKDCKIIYDIVDFNYYASYLNDLLINVKCIYTILKRFIPSGMSKSISIVICKNNNIIKIDCFVSKVLDYKIDNTNGGLINRCCNMDSGFNLVYNLMFTLYGKWNQSDIRHEWI